MKKKSERLTLKTQTSSGFLTALCHLYMNDIKIYFATFDFYGKDESCVKCGTHATTLIWLPVGWLNRNMKHTVTIIDFLIFLTGYTTNWRPLFGFGPYSNF